MRWLSFSTDRRFHKTPCYVIDFGASKIAMLSAFLDETGGITPLTYRAMALKGGQTSVLSNLHLSEGTLLNLLQATEESAGKSINSVYVAVPGHFYAGQTMSVEITIDTVVLEKDLHEAKEEAYKALVKQGVHPMHIFNLSYELDDVANIDNPLGLYGETLVAHFYTIYMEDNRYRTLKALTDRCHLKVEAYVASSVASAASTLTEQELELETCLIDIGASKSEIAIFNNGRCVDTHCFPVGGHLITKDLAYGLNVGFQQAERIKNLYSNAVNTRNSEFTKVPITTDDRSNQIQEMKQSFINSIVIARLKEILSILRGGLAKRDILSRPSRLVITGGTAQLNGFKELANLVFGRPLRIGIPENINAEEEHYLSTSMAPVFGVIKYASSPGRYGGDFKTREGGIVKRFKEWLNEVI